MIDVIILRFEFNIKTNIGLTDVIVDRITCRYFNIAKNAVRFKFGRSKGQ